MSWTFLGFIYNRFPRRISIPEQFTVNSLEELTQAIEKYRPNTRVGCSIYNYDGDTKDVIVDRIVWDLDSDNAFEDVKKLHKEFRNTTHFIVFSGKNFHFYLFTQGYNGDFGKQETLRAVYDHVQSKLGVVCDPSLYQNAITHMLACPSSFNFKAGRQKYVTFVSEQDLEAGYDHIRAKAEAPPDEFCVYGNDYFDLGPYKAATRDTRHANTATPESCGAPSDMDTWLAWQSRAVVAMLSRAEKCNYKSRFYVASYLRERGYTKEAAYAIMEHFYSKLPHESGGTMWDRVVKKNVIEQAYNGTLYSFPSEKKLKEEGYL